MTDEGLARSRPHVVVALTLAALLPMPEAYVVADQSQQRNDRLDLRIVDDDWGGPTTETVERVLRSVAVELLVHFPDVELPPLVVRPKGGPIVFHARGPDGEISIALNTGGTYWAQYAYQFAHELCHVLCGYDQDPTGQRWFEESLCEMASLYALRRMSERWRESPPYDHWRDFAPHLASYARRRIDDHALPAGQTLATWYRDNAAALAEQPTDRQRNTLVAGVLLPLFEREPTHWEALAWLNAARPTAPQTLDAYLQDWHDHSPERHRPFIRRVAAELGVTLSPTSKSP